MGQIRSELETLEGSSVLITGGAGFIGSHLADQLVDYCDVTVLDDLSNGNRDYVPEAANFVRGDIREGETLGRAFEGIDIVFHQAAIVSVNESVENPIESHETNLDATLTILEEARKHDVRVVLASSTAIYGEPETLPVSEEDSKTPSSPYGLDKLALDHYARLYNELYGLETVALRYFNVYGPRQGSGPYGGVISIFVDQALSGEPITIHGEGTQTRDFVHVSDVVQANIRAATTDVVGEAFNVGTGTEISILELAKLIRDVSDSDSELVHESARPGDVSKSRADIQRIQNRLDFTPEVTLEEGLRNLVEFRQNSEADD
ncbi:NAD-dependent epimerase/dehydratase family protein [Halalkaliarchaeum sp. AArc-GB]|uniref:NAD-dependent epimerase/dehydratase family protein n=1 Tax=Halalkaliarchaeum sp. AArc-GB TaxID=3074078 RepID=UPI0028593B45|nr:NAD-dependent epimerase/dehydratase family protein [Halalkaliarchaeum sp. AArc-GB]MDR5674208.1 NAD-dependent epimerase/dehydratase family protein [Halalkaliarchaeum sp. AArc-GB]